MYNSIALKRGTSYQSSSESPIGIFDSGIGGLTVARALVDLLPNENIFYFGDTAHFPYGDKSKASIEVYSLKVVEMLLERGCKLILIACNSASAAAYEFLKNKVAGKAFIVNVIDPVVSFLNDNFSGKRLGLIGTRLTINSDVYGKKLRALNSCIDFYSKATPLLAQVVEEGLYDTDVVDALLKIYLSDPKLQNIQSITLACTHYSLIKKKIFAFYQGRVDVLDTSVIVAQEVEKILARHNLLNFKKKTVQHFYISDYTNSFVEGAKNFFGREIKIESFHFK